MKKLGYRMLGAVLVSVASLFVLTGSYFVFYKPSMPAELRKKVG